jgi:hypothetical protein
MANYQQKVTTSGVGFPAASSSAPPLKTCLGCPKAFSNYHSMIRHIETNNCPSFLDPISLTRCLGKWWYASLYMDLDIHAQIRRNDKLDLNELTSWMEEGDMQIFVCRAKGCRQTSSLFSALVAHVEEGTCEWTVEKLKLDWLKRDLALLPAKQHG